MLNQRNTSIRQNITIVILIFFLLAGLDFAGFYLDRMKSTGEIEITPLPEYMGTTLEEITETNIDTEEVTDSIIDQSKNYVVVLKENIADKNKTDIYLHDPQNGEEYFYMTLSYVRNFHYHPAEYHNGNLYIIKHTGGNYGYHTNRNWTDELWRYHSKQDGIILFSSRGLDFRVSEDQNFISVFSSDEMNFIGNDGIIQKTFSIEQLGLTHPHVGPLLFSPIKWANSIFWVGVGSGPDILYVVKIAAKIYETTVFDLLDLPVDYGDFALNPAKEIIVFSDYPLLLCAILVEEYLKSGAQVNLFSYDLNTRVQQTIATSITKKFNPKWLDENTIEIDDPDGTGRITMQLP